MVTAVYNYLFWAWRFYSFGWKSRLGRCDMLTNPRAISIARGVQIRKGARLEAIGDWDGKLPKITIGERTAIQFHFHCGAAQSVTIGKDVLIAGRVYISDHDHVFDDPEKPAISCSKLSCKPVVIEDGVFLGQGCAILKGVTIGKRAIVGANAVVTKDVPPFTVVAGVPARVIRTIGEPEVK
jgi:acetyltransferase-like isoleucine patch superfamily enzyme